MKYSDICVTPLKGDRYKINKEIIYKDVIVPIGYRTNGADIPRIFWTILPPNRSDYLPAVIIHDYLCDQEDYIKADQYFDEILTSLKVENFTKYSLLFSVKLFHRVVYGVKWRSTAV